MGRRVPTLGGGLLMFEANNPVATMTVLDDNNAIYTIYAPPESAKNTFVFANSSGATTNTWEETIAPALRDAGYGTLSFDYRGQGESRYGSDAQLSPQEIVADIATLMQRVAPIRPILVGLSIGGLYAAKAILNGASAEGLVLINTLRKQNAQVEWINTLEERLIALGGMPLVLDVLRPVLSGCEQLEILRSSHLSDEGYTPWPEDHPRRRLAEQVKQADWDIPWQELKLPVLIFTGLHDRLFRIQQDVDELTALLPDSTTVTYPDGGHSLQAEYPQRFVADLIQFVDG